MFDINGIEIGPQEESESDSSAEERLPTAKWISQAGAMRSLANSMYTELFRAKSTDQDVLGFVGEMLGLLTERLRARAATARSKGIVLALGGGGARAAAHIGVLRQLRDAAIRVSGVAGTSAGALVGAMHAIGMSNEVALERFVAFGRSPLFHDMRRAYARFVAARGAPAKPSRTCRELGFGIAQTSADAPAVIPQDLYSAFIEYFVGADREISALHVPFSVAALDLVEGRVATISEGSLQGALRAACAVPGLFPPQKQGDQIFVDAAALSALPVEAALGLTSSEALVGVLLEHRKAAPAAFASGADLFARTASIAVDELTREQAKKLDCLITVPVRPLGWLSFDRAREVAETGRAAAEAAIELLTRDPAGAARVA